MTARTTSTNAVRTWEYAVPSAGTYTVAIMCGDADSRAQTNHLVVEGIPVRDATPYDGNVLNGYETGSFDGYALTVTVNDGKLTLVAAADSLAPKLNFIEISGPNLAALDQATIDLVTAAGVQATQDTARPKAKTPPLIKRSIWSGGYVDDLASYTVKKPRRAAVRYFAHANHLYSVAAITNTAGQVVERYSYNAYGVRTVKNPANVTIAKSVVGNDRGLTGYKLDTESNLMYARARMYSGILGRFVSRDPVTLVRFSGIGYPDPGMGYYDGMSLYRAYFLPNKLDPYGLLGKCRQKISAGHYDEVVADVKKELAAGRGCGSAIGTVSCFGDASNGAIDTAWPGGGIPGIPKNPGLLYCQQALATLQAAVDAANANVASLCKSDCCKKIRIYVTCSPDMATCISGTHGSKLCSYDVTIPCNK